MEQTAGGEDEQSLLGDLLSVSGAFEGSEDIAVARDLARTFLTDVQAVHGLPVSGRAMGMVQLVVSELVTNARKYAPGPCLLTLEISGGAIEVTVWDSNPTPPVILAPNPTRIGQHGLEIVMAVGQSFAIHREPVGKRITAAIVLADDPGGDLAGRQL
ncbi:ATP-binding protein [Streptomyces sp. NPDC093982]|uniref:ATP-binding protein n=1 Tax=Streptomyces sp. NPDC093982 TaxID=3155077 RepID=UPI0034376264